MRFQKGNKLGRKFEPGVSGNAGGRPRKKPITEAYERALTDAEADKIARGIIAAARRGNVKAASEITDRIEGKVTHTIAAAGALDLLPEALARARERMKNAER